VRERDQARRRALREPGRVGFFVDVPEARGLVDDEKPAVLGELEDVRRVDVLHVERRILAHQQGIEPLEPAAPRDPDLEPPLAVVTHGKPRPVPPWRAVSNLEVLLAKVNDVPPLTLGGE